MRTYLTKIQIALGRTVLVLAALQMQACKLQAANVTAAAAGSEEIQSLKNQPDVIVTEIHSSPAQPKAGDHVVFSATVKNQGGVATPAGVVVGVGFRVNGQPGSWAVSNAPIPAGATVTLAATGGQDGNNYWTATAGTFAVAAVADNIDRFAEADETNNDKTVSLYVEQSGMGVQAARADDFVDSIGVTAHLNWGGTVWDTKSSQWMPIFGESGIRNVRTQMATSQLAKSLLFNLNANYGVRALVGFSPRNPDNTLDPSKIQPTLDFIKNQVGVGKLIGLEGANEYNDTLAKDGNMQWASQLRSFQNELYRRVRTDSALNSLPVLAPSIWKNLFAAYAQIGSLDASTDIANLHYYTGGRRPTVTGLNQGMHTMDEAIGWAQAVAPSAPMWVTETGYNNMTDNVDSPYATPEKTQAKYSLRTFAEFFKRRDRVGKTFIYNFMDNPGVPDKVYGLLAQPAVQGGPLRRKPVFYAIKNAIKILADPGPSFAPGKLDFKLSGDTTSIVSVPMQKRDGRFYLMIWMDVDSIDREANPPQELNPAPRHLSLNVGSHRFSRMNVYHPTLNGNAGAAPVASIASPGVIGIDVPDHVMILEMVP